MQTLDKFLIKNKSLDLSATQLNVPQSNFGEVSLLKFNNEIGQYVVNSLINNIQFQFYPLSFDFRSYQYDIIIKALYRNTLVCLPTGLGKTWVAAIMILNYYLWFPDGYIFFLAPTRPLVMQQIETLKQFEGIISEQELGILLGKNTKRASEYINQRIIFMTPQTLLNDLKNKLFDSKKISLIVFDEAHRATGDYAYTIIVKILKEEKVGFRVLALSATPGNNIEKVQEVVSNLCISDLEVISINSFLQQQYKDDQDPDVKKYIKDRKVKIEIIKNNQLVKNLNDKLVAVIEIVVKGILRFQIVPLSLISSFINADQITNGICFLLREELFKKEQEIIKKIGSDNFSIIKNTLSFLCQLTFSKKVLMESGVISFIDYVTNLDGNMKPSHKQIVADQETYIDFKKHCQSVKQQNLNNHPKLVRMTEILKEFYSKPQNISRLAKVIVFTNNRGTAKEICEYITQYLSENIVRSSIFIGQQNKEGGIEGMSQKLQIEVMKKFKENIFNLLIATCIAEEGLDIGEVDLIICYDNGFSPIRMIQRMGRTGRKRDGEIIILLMEGQEQRNYEKQKKEGKKIKQQIKQSSKEGKQQNITNQSKQVSKINFYSFPSLMIPENHSQQLVQFTNPLNCKQLETFFVQKNLRQLQDAQQNSSKSFKKQLKQKNSKKISKNQNNEQKIKDCCNNDLDSVSNGQLQEKALSTSEDTQDYCQENIINVTDKQINDLINKYATLEQHNETNDDEKTLIRTKIDSQGRLEIQKPSVFSDRQEDKNSDLIFNSQTKKSYFRTSIDNLLIQQETNFDRKENSIQDEQIEIYSSGKLKNQREQLNFETEQLYQNDENNVSDSEADSIDYNYLNSLIINDEDSNDIDFDLLSTLITAGSNEKGFIIQKQSSENTLLNQKSLN